MRGAGKGRGRAEAEMSLQLELILSLMHRECWCVTSPAVLPAFRGALLYPTISQSQPQTKKTSSVRPLKELTSLGDLPPYSLPLFLPSGGMQM